MAALQWTRYESREPVAHEETRVRAMAGVTDILTVGTNPTLGIYLSDLFRRFGWSVIRTRDCESAIRFLRENRAAVAVCEELLPGGGWQDVVARLGSVPDAPALVVLADDAQLSEVISSGGFDVLTRPLREADVVWTIATAWHHWVKRFEEGENGGARCSDA